MEKIKDITLSIFAVIGFVAILSSFTNNNIQEETTEADYAVHKSHIWEGMTTLNENGEGRFYLYNKVTGEVRKYSRSMPIKKGQSGSELSSDYIVVVERTYDNE